MKPKEGIIAQELGDEFLLVPIGEAAKDFHGLVRLNETGYFIWKALSEGLNEEQIASRIVEEYDGVDLEHAKKSVHTLIESLQDAKLLV